MMAGAGNPTAGGADEVNRNLDAYCERLMMVLMEAAGEIASLLENYAKEHHGNAPRAAGWVYPGGGVRRWREAGTGWGDVTGNLQNSIRADAQRVSRDIVRVVLSAGMDYAKFVELAHQGKWSWLWPAVEANHQNIMSILRRHLAG